MSALKVFHFSKDLIEFADCGMSPNTVSKTAACVTPFRGFSTALKVQRLYRLRSLVANGFV